MTSRLLPPHQRTLGFLLCLVLLIALVNIIFTGLTLYDGRVTSNGFPSEIYKAAIIVLLVAGFWTVLVGTVMFILAIGADLAAAGVVTALFFSTFGLLSTGLWIVSGLLIKKAHLSNTSDTSSATWTCPPGLRYPWARCRFIGEMEILSYVLTGLCGAFTLLCIAWVIRRVILRTRHLRV
ncbi:SubName: Full=Uncharacterized protein {ECO:0000313/EMBL:CCA69743.1} [Serendipita indica DSM 11827]|nr:SubName: Full=Uncharacterized protein {ECO:0000313/EMBL:CCA69743.1} [Serendipita indica DSM 11827]